MNHALGISMILAFCLSQAFRDVYLGHVFQKVDFFAVILLAFIPSTLVFGAIAWRYRRGDFQLLGRHVPTLVAMNVATAMAWTSYFFGLAHIEPAVVNTLHSGVAPLTVIALSAAGIAMAGSHTVRLLEGALLAGMAATLAGLWWVVLDGRSGLAGASWQSSLPALCLLIVSGASITISHLFAKTLSSAGIGAAAITASRYMLIIAMALVFILLRGNPSGITGIGHGALLGLAAALLIALPLYALQIGIAHTPQLMSHILRALGPVFVFALQQFDGRVNWSGPVLALILAYSVFVAGANIAHGFAARSTRERSG
jgi:drug/metabolite transporter (DMT)-like permease